MESCRSLSAPARVDCAVLYCLSERFTPTACACCLAGLWDYTQHASLGQEGNAISGTSLLTSTRRGGLGMRRALRDLCVYILVIFFPVTVAFDWAEV